MKLEDFFLICFGFGITMSLIAFLSARLHFHLPNKLHLPHFGHSGHHIHVPHAHGKFVAKGAANSGASGADGTGMADFSQISPFNFPSLMMFLAWFGGIGYLASHNYGIGLYLALAVGGAAGILGGGAVYLFLRKVLSYENPLDPADFEMVGVVGRLTVSIRAGEDGHGELTYEQQGIRSCCGARSADCKAIEKDAEVVITGFENGIAVVKRWEEFTGM